MSSHDGYWNVKVRGDGEDKSSPVSVKVRNVLGNELNWVINQRTGVLRAEFYNGPAKPENLVVRLAPGYSEITFGKHYTPAVGRDDTGNYVYASQAAVSLLGELRALIEAMPGVSKTDRYRTFLKPALDEILAIHRMAPDEAYT